MESNSNHLTENLHTDVVRSVNTSRHTTTSSRVREIVFGYKGSAILLAIGILLCLFVVTVYGHSRGCTLLVALSLLPFLSHVICVFGIRRNIYLPNPHACCKRRERSPSRPWLAAYILLCSLVGGGIALYNYCAWWQADTWMASGWNWQGIFHWYLHTNSRIGEIILRLVRLDYSRWLSWSAFPCCILLVIFSMWKIGGKGMHQLPSMVGCCYTVFTASLLLLAVNLDSSRDYHDFAAMTNYLWPTAALFLLLTRFQTPSCLDVQRESTLARNLKYLLIFLLGIFAGWGTELGCVLFVIGGIIWLLYHIYNKLTISIDKWLSLTGFAWGCVMLFLSPAHAGRSANSASMRIVNPSDMKAEELQMWLSDLNWEKLHQLQAQGVILLDGIPYADHIKFLPFLAERFWTCCNVPSIAVLILLTFVMCRPGVHYKRRVILLITLGAYSLTWLGVCTYLIKVIPSYMSFLPASYVVVLIAAWLFMQLPTKWISQLVFTLVFTGFMLGIYIPRIEVGLQYKPLERAMWNEIAAQKKNGLHHVRLDRKFIPPHHAQINDGGLVSNGKLNVIANQYPNFLTAAYFQVQSIGYSDESDNSNE